MWSYFIELAIFGLFILLANKFKICSKNSKKDIARSIIVGVAFILGNVLIDFIFNIILLFIYDMPSAYMTFAFLMDIIDILLPALGAYVISQLLGCKRKIGIIAALTAIVVLISLALSYVEIDTIKVPDETLESIEEISAYEETSEKTAAFFTIIRNIINLVPSLSYVVYCLSSRGDTKAYNKQSKKK